MLLGSCLVAVTVAPDASASVGPGSPYTAVAPTRLLDTRSGVGAPREALAAGSSLVLHVAGRGGVPAAASAVALNVTVVAPTASGFVSVAPQRTTSSSNLNFRPGQVTPNLVVSDLAGDGTVTLTNGSRGTVQLLADVQGWFGSSAASGYVPTDPARLLDTRSGDGAPRQAVAAGQSLVLQVRGRSGVPARASAVALNVTVVSPQAAGFVSVAPQATTASSNLNFVRGQVSPNLVLTDLAPDGTVTLTNGSSAPLHLLADVQGWFVPDSGAGYTALAPARVLDTRSGNGSTAATVPGGRSLVLQVRQRGGVPDSAAAVALNVTVVQPSSAGFVSVAPARTLEVSNLNFTAGQTVPNLVISRLAPDGTVTLTNGSPAPLHLLADVQGWFSGDGDAAAPVPPSPAPSAAPSPSGSPEAGPAPTSVDRTVLVVLLSTPTHASKRTVAEVRAAIFADTGSSTRTYYQETSGGRLFLAGRLDRQGGDVRTQAIDEPSGDPCLGNTWRDAGRAALTASGVDSRAWDTTVWITPDGVTGCPINGIGTEGTPGGANTGYSVVILDKFASLTQRTLAHEIGHNLSLDHATTDDCTGPDGTPVTLSTTCTQPERNDPNDGMGATARGEEHGHLMSAMRLLSLGWMPAADVTEASAGGTFTLRPLYGAGGGTRALRLPSPVSGMDYWLETRQPFGRYDDFSPDDPTVGTLLVRLHPRDTGRRISQLLDMHPGTGFSARGSVDAGLALGETFTDYAGRSFSLTGRAADGTLTVRIG